MNIKEDFKTLFKIIKIFVTIVKLILYIKAYYDKNTKLKIKSNKHDRLS